MELFFNHFKESVRRMAIIGMVHVRALPATPKSILTVQQLIEKACEEAITYCKHGIDGICIENMFDIPYVQTKDSGPETTAIITRIATEIRKIVPQNIPCGVQILAAQNQQALAVALAADLQFIRAEGFVFGHVADEGYIDSCAGQLLRYRKQINANNIAILTDIKKKHCSHSLTSDVNIVDTAKAARFFLSDGLILTGKETGHCPDLDEVIRVRRELNDIPIIVGSGVSRQNVVQYSRNGVNAAIVGSEFKINGQWFNDICHERLVRFIDTLKSI
ncbi:hypothetical protein BLOT_011734 [Blomia tropicalis]|nr:hypothetical protein BLOT_011734 [Blomia tropicalis]